VSAKRNPSRRAYLHLHAGTYDIKGIHNTICSKIESDIQHKEFLHIQIPPFDLVLLVKGRVSAVEAGGSVFVRTGWYSGVFSFIYRLYHKTNRSSK